MSVPRVLGSGSNIKELMLYLCAYGLTTARDCMEADYFAMLLWASSFSSLQRLSISNEIRHGNFYSPIFNTKV
jgi:hypothetical protein